MQANSSRTPICNSFGRKILPLAAISLLLSGCNSGRSAPTPKNFTTAINKYLLDHPDCLLADTRFPFETSDAAKTKQMDTLVKSLLLEKTYEASVHVSRYTVSKSGERYAPRFCYGHREVTGIESFTPLAVVKGFKQTNVAYSYSMKEVPVWALSHDVQAAFPDMARVVNNQGADKIDLAQTTAGWEVPE